MNEDKYKLIILGLVLLCAYLYFQYPNELKTNYEKLKLDYTQLQNSYNQITIEKDNLLKENEALRLKQKALEQQIASYLLEQTAIDFLGIKKYQLLYDLTKIYVCNKSPSFPAC